MKNIAVFDAAEYLDNEAVIAEYINAALEDENPNVFLQAIADVAKARGMSKLAKDTGLGRESLYKALAPGAKPRYDTVLKLVRALGVELHATTLHAASPNNSFKPKPLRGSA
jgi:probable addiction module antidote protein